MINTVKTPRINTNDDKVGLVAWHVNDGDYVEIGQAVADLETSKAPLVSSFFLIKDPSA